MCNPTLLKLFISMCLSVSGHSQPLYNCVKAFDICVERQYWELEDHTVSSMTEREKRDWTIDTCEDELLNRRLFSEYYSDDRCNW